MLYAVCTPRAMTRDDRTFIAVVIAGYCLAALYLATPLMPDMPPSTFLWLSATAWTGIQAIGSIVAIGAAGVFIRWQVGEQGRQQRELLIEQQAEQTRQRAADDVRRLQIVASAFFHCRTMLESMTHRVKRGLAIEAELGHLVSHAEAMYAIPSMDVPDARATYAIASTRSTVDTLRRELASLLPVKGVASAREKHLNVALSFLDSHEQTVADCLYERGSTPLHQKYKLDDGSAEPLVVYSFGHPEQFGFVASDYVEAAR